MCFDLIGKLANSLLILKEIKLKKSVQAQLSKHPLPSFCLPKVSINLHLLILNTEASLSLI